MKTLDIETITESLERSFQNCSLNHHNRELSASVVGESSSSSDHANAAPEYNLNRRDQRLRFDATLELNSHVSLPYYWEQCLDLETGDIYYINWKTGMKSSEDPRLSQDNYYFNGDYYSEDNESSYESEDSSSESSISSSRQQHQRQQQQCNAAEKEDNGSNSNSNGVLVVAGCQRCFMYFMVPKHVHDCPKCFGQLLQLDNHGGRSQNASP